MRIWTRLAGFAWVAACLAACGGGGGGGGGNNIVPPPAASIALSPSSISASAASGEAAPTASFVVTAANIPDDGLYIEIEYTINGIADLDMGMISDTQARIDIYFHAPAVVGAGTHVDSIIVKVCYDEPCARQVVGSPATVSVKYEVAGLRIPEEPGLPVLPVLSRAELSHDVVDAEYSDALDAVVMVSSSPTNALHVFDPATGERYQVALNKVPTSVSVSPDGLAAAVGHDALISYVDLAELVQTGATTPVHLGVSAQVSDVVLDGRGFVHAFPAPIRWVGIHSIEIATNTETVGSGLIYGGTRARLHPSGDFIYGADNWLSPSDIEKYDIRSGPAAYLYDSPYHGTYEMCGELWIKENGQTIYTACGNTFSASLMQADDMLYTGRLALSGGPFDYRITHLSQSDEMNEIMLVEANSYYCNTFTYHEQCWTHVALYDSDFLNRSAVYSIAPLRVDGSDYMQRGLFVFHSADGSRRYMISHLPLGPGTSHYLSVLQ
jgi:hypothetical protein